MPASPFSIARVVKLLCRGLGDPAIPRTPWKYADYRKRGALHLFIDGWMSQGNDGHLAPIHLERMSALDPRWQPRVEGFSYYGRNRTYIGDDTNHPTNRSQVS